jgi:hypothetical protein
MARAFDALTRDRTLVRSATALTASYVAGTAVDVSGVSKATVFLSLTLGSLTSAEVKAEFSEGNDWFQQTDANGALREYSFTASSKRAVDLGGFVAKSLRIAAKGTGTPTGSSLEIAVCTRQ